MPKQNNTHATVIVLGDRGILIKGKSGSGKTSLALALIRHCHGAGMFACLVGDDQVYLSAKNGHLVARAPATLAGLAEVRGLGPRPIPFESEAVVDLVVWLVDPQSAPRFNDQDRDQFTGVEIPRLVLAERNEIGAMNAVLAAISALPFHQ